MLGEGIIAPCGCWTELTPRPLDALWRFWMICDEHYQQAQASTPVLNVYGEPTEPVIFDAVDALEAGLRAIRDMTDRPTFQEPAQSLRFTTRCDK